jgi:hypothetical protein
MDTDGRRTGPPVHSGTNVIDMEAGLTQYLSWTGVNPLGDANGDGIVDQTDVGIVLAAMGSSPGMGTWNLYADIWPATVSYPYWTDNTIDQNDLDLVNANLGRTGLFYEHTMPQPNFYFIEEEVERCQDVVLLIDYYYYDTTYQYWEPMYDSGHFVTVAGVDSQNLKLAISDPTQDAYEDSTIPEGRVPIPHAPSPPYTIHNNASLVSQDTYNVVQLSAIGFPGCPGGDWALLNYDGFMPPYFAVITSAVITSPSATRDVAVTNVTTCKDGCFPFPTVPRNWQLHINVTVENQGNYTETLAITVYADNDTGSFEINMTQLVLPNATSIVLGVRWNASLSYGNYTIRAVVDAGWCEWDTTDNIFVGTKVEVTLLGDVNGDLNVLPVDLATLISAYGSPLGIRPYNPNCDLDDNHAVEPFDLACLIANYGKHYP